MPSDQGGSTLIDVCLAQREEPGRLADVSPASSPFSRKYLEARGVIHVVPAGENMGQRCGRSRCNVQASKKVQAVNNAENMRKELPGGLHPVYRRLHGPTQNMLRSTSTGVIGPGRLVSGLSLALKLLRTRHVSSGDPGLRWEISNLSLTLRTAVLLAVAETGEGRSLPSSLGRRWIVEQGAHKHVQCQRLLSANCLNREIAVSYSGQ